MCFPCHLIVIIQCNIRVLGGLVSAHLLASDSSKKLFQGAYKNQLLVLAEDLGKRFLPAFNTPTGLPYAWINLKVLYRTHNKFGKCLGLAAYDCRLTMNISNDVFSPLVHLFREETLLKTLAVSLLLGHATFIQIVWLFIIPPIIPIMLSSVAMLILFSLQQSIVFGMPHFVMLSLQLSGLWTQLYF